MKRLGLRNFGGKIFQRGKVNRLHREFSRVGAHMCTQDYKSVHAEVVIRATLVNTHTHTQTDSL